jgi:carboxymethylenebutenolidase
MYRLDPDDPQSIARVQQLIGRTTTANVRSDVADVLRWADDSGWTRGSAVGCVGYCFSGPFAVDVANSFPDRIRAAACFHGVRLHTDRPDSPHLALSNAGAEFYVGAAEHDEYAPAEMIERLATAMAAAGVRHRIEWYANTEHGFVFPRRPAYDARAAERHWERLLDLFARTLTHVSQ